MVNLNAVCPVLSSNASSHDTMVSAVYRVLAERLRLLQLKPLSRVTLTNEKQPKNALPLIDTILLGKLIVVNEEQSWNASVPINTILSGRLIVDSEEQFWNAL